MPISFPCPSCGKRLKAPEKVAGKRITCPACHNKVIIPQLMGAEDADDLPAKVWDQESSSSPTKKPECPRCGLLLAPLDGSQERVCPKCDHEKLARLLSVPSAKDTIPHKPEVTFATSGQKSRPFYSKPALIATLAVAAISAVGMCAFVVLRKDPNQVEKPGPVAAAQKPELTEDTKQQLESQLELMIALNRYRSLNEEAVFWMSRNPDTSIVDDLVAEGKDLKQQVDSIDQNINKRWGNKSKALWQLSSEHVKKSKILSEGTTQTVSVILAGRNKTMALEIEKLEADLKVEFPLVLPPLKFFDRSTYAGQIATQEEELRRPAQDNLTKAKRNVEIARARIKRVPLIMKNNVNKGHDDCKNAIAKLEAAFRD